MVRCQRGVEVNTPRLNGRGEGLLETVRWPNRILDTLKRFETGYRFSHSP
jgi:hypothetical protein